MYIYIYIYIYLFIYLFIINKYIYISSFSYVNNVRLNYLAEKKDVSLVKSRSGDSDYECEHTRTRMCMCVWYLCMQYIVIFSNILYLFYFCQSQYVQRRRLPCFLRILFSFPLSSEVHNHKIKRKICHLHLTYSSSLVSFPFLDSSKPPSFLYKTIASSVPANAQNHTRARTHLYTLSFYLAYM